MVTPLQAKRAFLALVWSYCTTCTSLINILISGCVAHKLPLEDMYKQRLLNTCDLLYSLRDNFGKLLNLSGDETESEVASKADN